MSQQLQVNEAHGLIIAQLRGVPTEALLSQCQEQVVNLARHGKPAKVLYDTLQMQAPHVDVPWFQRRLDEALGAVSLRRAIVVPDSKLAYLARLAFGEGDYRVFYSDIFCALKWLNDTALAPPRAPN